jgi:hypothetical protein
MSSGFEEDDDDMIDAIKEADLAKIVVFAAASNSGNIDYVTFPARMQGHVMCIFSSNGNVKPSVDFNPSALQSANQNFAVLGEEVAIGFRDSGEEVRESGTSIATFIAAGIAARIIDFSRQEDTEAYILQRERNRLKTYAGMSAVFEEMAKGGHEGGYKCIAPWKIARFSRWQNTSDYARMRQWICYTIVQALDPARRG